jgi:D-sedoheptulose 7-phosphate isomerase
MQKTIWNFFTDMNDDNEKIFFGAFKRHAEVLAKTNGLLLSDIQKAGELIIETVKAGGTLYACGNGGSAADAQHLAGEFLCRYKDDRQPLPAMFLGADFSTITAIGNDYSFEEVFSRPLTALGKKGDILVAFSTSGTSPNVIRALGAARAKGMATILMTSQKIKDDSIADIVIKIPAHETARIQEMHELIYHAWCEYVDAQLTKVKNIDI